MDYTRRQLLARMVASGLMPLAGCTGAGTATRPDPTGTTGLTDTATSTLIDSGTDALFPITKRPWVQILGPDRVRLRFEARKALDDLSLILPGGDVAFTTSTEDVAWSADLSSASDDFLPDEPGAHTVHEAVIEGLTAGETVAWSIVRGGELAWEGSFRAPAAPGQAFRLGWVSDTMTPFSDAPVAALSALAPDLVLHGGDIQYRSQPSDTWAGASRAFQPLTDTAAMHFAIGNHEFEGSSEESGMFDRLFAGQGAAGDGRYHAFSYGALRIVMLDSESSGFVDGSPQLQFLDAELAAHDHVVIGFHRPLFTLSKHAPSDLTARDLLHPRFVAHGGVKAVMCGHAHCYERWEVEGVTYVVDGGGGAGVYDPNERAESVESQRPGEPDLRVVADMTHGATLLEVGVAGSIEGQRVNAQGEVVDRFTRA